MSRVVVREDIKPLYRGAGRLIRAGETGEELTREVPDHQYATSSRSVVRFDADPQDCHDVPSRFLTVVGESGEPKETERP